jgi:hypothetical protein
MPKKFYYEIPRCGAHARSTGQPCRAPALENGRCKKHGGRHRGPKTEDGRLRSLAGLKCFRGLTLDQIRERVAPLTDVQARLEARHAAVREKRVTDRRAAWIAAGCPNA